MKHIRHLTRGHLIQAVVLVAALFFSSHASAFASGTTGVCRCQCSYSVGDWRTNGDYYYNLLAADWRVNGTTMRGSWCSPAVKAAVADAFGMTGSGWFVSGWGGGGDCSGRDTPYNRAVGAGALLFLAAPDLDSYTDYALFFNRSELLINWAAWYVMSKLDDTRGRCFSGEDDDGGCRSARASTNVGSGRVSLYMRSSGNACQQVYFSGSDRPNQSIAQRAGTLVHEARHVAGYRHEGSNGTNDVRWGGGGAWDYHYIWLRQYAFFGSKSTASLRCDAARRASQIIQNQYDDPVPNPAFDIPVECT